MAEKKVAAEKNVVKEEVPNVQLQIKAPNIKTLALGIRGTAPYVQHKFSQKAKQAIMDTQVAGSITKKGKKRPGKDYDQEYKDAMHISREGWHGIPASGDDG